MIYRGFEIVQMTNGKFVIRGLVETFENEEQAMTYIDNLKCKP